MLPSTEVKQPEVNLGKIILKTRTQLGYSIHEEYSWRGKASRLWHRVTRVASMPEFDENAIIRDAAAFTNRALVPINGFPPELYDSTFVHPYVAEHFARLLQAGMKKYLASRGTVEHPQQSIDYACQEMMALARQS
jgi:hypothetical protein